METFVKVESKSLPYICGSELTTWDASNVSSWHFNARFRGFVKRCLQTSLCFSVQVTADVSQLLGEQKVDAILCVAGGWAGGKCSSKGQSSTTSCLFPTLIISHLFPCSDSRVIMKRSSINCTYVILLLKEVRQNNLHLAFPLIIQWISAVKHKMSVFNLFLILSNVQARKIQT